MKGFLCCATSKSVNSQVFCFIKSVASRLDAEFVKTTIEMEKICGMLNWKYLFLTDQTRFCLDTDKWCGFEAEIEIISGLRPEHVSAEIKFQGFVARDFR